MRSWIGLLMSLTCPLEQKSRLSLISRALHWASQQLNHVLGGALCSCESSPARHGTQYTSSACMCAGEKLKNIFPWENIDLCRLLWGSTDVVLYQTDFNSTRNEGATPLELVKSPSTLFSLRWQSCDKGKLQEKQVPLGMNPVYKQGRIAEQMSCKTEANYVLTFSLWVFPWCLINFPVNWLTYQLGVLLRKEGNVGCQLSLGVGFLKCFISR